MTTARAISRPGLVVGLFPEANTDPISLPYPATEGGATGRGESV
jgi:hypothetical protein